MSRTPAKVLLDRAAALAKPRHAQTTPTVSMLGFVLGEERFLSPLAPLREVTPVRRLTIIPGLPPLFAGLSNVRGAVVAVLDVRQVLGVETPRPEHPDAILLIESDGATVAVWVDRLEGLAQVDLTTLRPDHGSSARWFKGRTNDLATVIDLPAAVSAALTHITTDQPAEEA
jgi:purine-binding chemotaxis protein CheW